MKRTRQDPRMVCLICVWGILCLLLTGCGSGSRGSLQERIDQAQESDILVLDAGAYKGNYKIRKSLTIRGATADKPVVLRGNEDATPVFDIRGEVAVRMEGVEIVSSRGTGIVVGGDADVTLDRVTIRNCQRSGVSVEERAEVCLTDCRIETCTRNGLSLAGSSSVELTGCEINGHTAMGIATASEARLEISDSTIRDNGESGLRLGGTTQARLDAVKIIGNGHGEGQIAEFGGLATVIMSWSDCGIWLREQCEVSITFCEVRDSGDAGIAGECRRLEVNGVAVSNNQGCGLVLWGGSQVLVANSNILHNGGMGLLAGEEAVVHLTSCMITANERGGIAEYSPQCLPGATWSGPVRFQGRIYGSGNTIPGPEEVHGNGIMACCPGRLHEVLCMPSDSGSGEVDTD